MQISVNVPDNLPQDTLAARVKQFEEALAQEAAQLAKPAGAGGGASPWDDMDDDSWEH